MVNVNYQEWPNLLYCHFNKIIKGHETSFQFQALQLKTFLKLLPYKTLVFDQISFL